MLQTIKMRLLNIITVLFLFAFHIEALAVKRFFQSTSPTFSLIAYHNGSVFQYNLVKYDGTDLVLHQDDKAFFGRIRAHEGYILNLPAANASNNSSKSYLPSTVNVRVDNTSRLTTTSESNLSSEHFGISHSLLTYHNSTRFLACPSNSYTGGYHIYFKGKRNLTCPTNSTGYDIALLVQVDATTEYNPETNVDRFSYKKY